MTSEVTCDEASVSHIFSNMEFEQNKSFLPLSCSQSLSQESQAYCSLPNMGKLSFHHTRSLASPSLVAHIPGLLWTSFFFFFPFSSFFSFSFFSPKSPRGEFNICPSFLFHHAVGSASRNWTLSWNLSPPLWVSEWPGRAQWYPFPPGPGPSLESSPCSATCGSPCLSQGWEPRSPRPHLEKGVTDISF